MCVAETVALASGGQVFAPDGNGTIWHAASLNSPLEEWAQIGGRPLGAMVDSKGDLFIADAARVRRPSIWLYLKFGQWWGYESYIRQSLLLSCSLLTTIVLSCPAVQRLPPVSLPVSPCLEYVETFWP